jgi:hypothetical protein
MQAMQDPKDHLATTAFLVYLVLLVEMALKVLLDLEDPEEQQEGKEMTALKVHDLLKTVFLIVSKAGFR